MYAVNSIISTSETNKPLRVVEGMKRRMAMTISATGTNHAIAPAIDFRIGDSLIWSWKTLYSLNLLTAL